MPYANALGARLFYQRHGKGNPVVFLPGVCSDLRSRSNVYNSHLANKFDILTLDHRGTGRSEKPDTPYSMKQYALDAAAVMDAVDWQTAHVIGVSFGGMVAQELAIRCPDRVRSLTLCCTTSGGAGGSSYPLHTLPDPAPDMRSHKMLGIWDTRRNATWQAEHPEKTRRILTRAATNTPPFLHEMGGATGFKRQLEARSHHNTYERLSAIQVPTLVCGGYYDGNAKPEFVVNLHKQIPGSRLQFFEGGHNFLSQDPNAYKFIAATLESLLTKTCVEL
jgi:3-oxoadipate enol-lactonase